MLAIDMPIIPDMRYVCGEPLATENIRVMPPMPRAIGSIATRELTSGVAGSPRTGGSARSTWFSGDSGPVARGPRFTITVLMGIRSPTDVAAS